MTAVAFNSAFPDQVSFFRQKLNLPTERWDDIQRAAHDRAFIVAGAMKADLLQDLRDVVQTSIEQGKSLDWFRDQFDDIVARHGWAGWTGSESEAGRDWRTRVIYQTNMSTSYSAGRWAQLNDPGLAKLRPYWKYRHADGVLHPRPYHVALNGLVLPRDHPFWKTFFPPNGWGCHCYVEAVGKAEYDRAVAAGKATPPSWSNEINPKTGAPIGIDRGFDYAPGANVDTSLQALIDQKLFNLDAQIGAAMWQQLAPALEAERAAAWSDWVSGVIERGQAGNDIANAGALTPEVVDFLIARDLPPQTASITLGDAELLHLWRDTKAARGATIAHDDLLRLPQILAQPRAILFDSEDPALLYVFDPGGAEGAGKIVVRVNYVVKANIGGKRAKPVTNSVRTAGIATKGDLVARRYVVVSGKL